MTYPDKIRLLIVDDHKIVINGIRTVVKDQPDLQFVGFALSAEEALVWLHENLADVVLLDIQMPGKDGIELCKTLKKEFPRMKIIGLTSFSQVSFISEMLRNGADGYLFKSTSEHELLDAIRTVHKGEQYLSKEVNDRMIAKAMFKTRSDSSFIPKITRREKQVLGLIAEENTTQEIAQKLFLSISTVETHRMNLCSKLDARNTAGLVKKAIKFGLI